MKNKATEEREKSLPRRIFAGVLGLLLVLALLTGVSFVTGNPLAEALARRRAANYLSTTYPGREFTVSEVSKSGAGRLDYSMRVDETGLLDGGFFLFVPLWGEVQDTRDYWVNTMRNTAQRLGNELAGAAALALEQAGFPVLERCTATMGYEPDMQESFPQMPFASRMELDMPLDPAAPPVPVRLELELVDPQPGKERARQLLDQAQTALREAGIRVDYYCLTLYTKDFAPFADVGRQYQLEDVPAGKS